MVQRYDIEEMSGNPWESHRCIEENDEGDYVKYEDYKAIQQTLAATHSYVYDNVKRNDPHATGLLRAIDNMLK